MAVVACDKVTALEVQMDAGRPIDPGCISGLEKALGSTDGFYRGTQPSGSAVEEVQIVRGSGSVHVSRIDPASHAIRFNVTWLGPSDEKRERDTVALFTNVRDTVLRTCGLDANSVQVTSRCGGSVCRYPEIAALRSAQGRGETPEE